jgi:hypothetical protein
MARDKASVRIATDKNGLSDCKCGENQLIWQSKEDYLAHEADHSLEQAREIDESALPWNRRSPEDIERLLGQDAGPDNWEEWAEREKGRAERNGLSAVCKNCYGTMSPTMATEELMDISEER